MVVGKWYGTMTPIMAIKFKGAKIFTHIADSDSAFILTTRDTTRDTTLAIKDTTLVLSGIWRLNAAKDSVLLLPDTCRVVDTTLNTLVPRPVKGQVIPMFMNISKNPDNGKVEWEVALIDLVPLAPLIGINLTGVDQSVLQVVKIILEKREAGRCNSGWNFK
jgi:hypothetical protein